MSFLRTGLGMLVDGYTEGEIRDSLTAEMHFFEKRRLEQQRVFRHMAQIAPAFGVVGSIVGLVGLLVGLGDTAMSAPRRRLTPSEPPPHPSAVANP